MMNRVVSTTKKFLVVGGIAFGLAGSGLFGGVGTALADGTKPDTGTYDELLFILDEDGYQSLIASTFGPGANVTGTYQGGNLSGSWPGGNAKP
jgi:uncharacterized membrane protein